MAWPQQSNGNSLCSGVINLEGDSLNVVKAIKEKLPSRHHYGQILNDVQLVLQTLRIFKVGDVKQEANMAAYTLAKEASKTPIDRI
jgi:hypothetical protein